MFFPNRFFGVLTFLVITLTTACSSYIGGVDDGIDNINNAAFDQGDNSSGDQDNNSSNNNTNPPVPPPTPSPTPDPNQYPDLTAPTVSGPTTIWVENIPGQQPKIIRTMGDGSLQTLYTQPGGQPFPNNVLAYALRVLARQGDVIAIDGVFNKLDFGRYNSHSPDAVYWEVPGTMGNCMNGTYPEPEQLLIRDITIMSVNAQTPAIIGGISLGGNIYSPLCQGGFDNLQFRDVIFRTDASGVMKTSVVVNIGARVGALIFYNVSLQSHPNAPGTSWGGYPAMWGIRAHGHLGIGSKFWFVTCATRLQEHCLYMDNIGHNLPAGQQGRIEIVGLRQLGDSGRTGIQIVNRAKTCQQDPVVCGGPSGKGDLIIRDVDLHTIAGGGGAALTVAGHLGNVWIKDVRILTDMGGIAFWESVGHGLHLNANGYTVPFAMVEDVQITALPYTQPSMNKVFMQFSGVENLFIKNFDLTGSRTSVSLFDDYGGPIDNGNVCFSLPTAPSLHTGWGSGAKVKYCNNSNSTLCPNGVQTLNNAQMDAMQCP